VRSSSSHWRTAGSGRPARAVQGHALGNKRAALAPDRKSHAAARFGGGENNTGQHRSHVRVIINETYESYRSAE
jgi:hypothetical protein